MLISESLFLLNKNNYSGGYIVPELAYETPGTDGFITNPVGTRPLMPEQHHPQVRVELAANAPRFPGTAQMPGVLTTLMIDLVSTEQFRYRQSADGRQEELRPEGIIVNLDVVLPATMHETIRETRNPITLCVAFRQTADTYLARFFNTDGDVTHYSIFTVDALREEARAATDAAYQPKLWKEANVDIRSNSAGYGLRLANQHSLAGIRWIMGTNSPRWCGSIRELTKPRLSVDN